MGFNSGFKGLNKRRSSSDRAIALPVSHRSYIAE